MYTAAVDGGELHARGVASGCGANTSMDGAADVELRGTTRWDTGVAIAEDDKDEEA